MPTGTWPGGDRADHGAEEERHEHRRGREDGAERARLGHRRRLAAHGERGAAEDDPQRGAEQRHVERRHDRAEEHRERRPQHDEQEDQPHVVGLPHRAHRALDHPAHPPAARVAARGQVPEARAQVGARQHRVGGQREQRESQADLGHQPASTGPPTSTSGGRLASRRSSHATVPASVM